MTAVETAIGKFEVDRAVTNERQVVLFEIGSDNRLHVNITHKHPTKTVRGWAGPANLPSGFVHNRTFGDRESGEIVGQIRHMVFAGRAVR